MPRARKKKQPEPTPVADVLDTMPVAKMLEHKPDSSESAQPEDPVAVFEKQRAREQAATEPASVSNEASRPKAEIEPERLAPEPQKHLDDKPVVSIPQDPEVLGEHTAAVVARRPKMQPAPAGFHPGPRFPQAGIRVNRGVERLNYGTAAIQFSEERPLSREREYAHMERIQDKGFQYQRPTRQWERRTPEGMAHSDNFIEAGRLAKEIAESRNEGRGR